MGDLIDRNDAVEAIEFEKVYMTAYKGNSNGYVSEGNPLKQYNKGLDDAIKAINSLAPVEPERKKGQWIDEPYKIWNAHLIRHCSNCGWSIHRSHLRQSDLHLNFCPNCGSRMTRGE